MEVPKIFKSEYRFACIVWDREPVKMKELIAVCNEKLGWKRTTTYTVLKRLSERGIFQMKDGVVTSLISKEEIQREESRCFVEDTFGGSLPAFVAAFVQNQSLSAKEAEEIRRMLDAYTEQEKKPD